MTNEKAVDLLRRMQEPEAYEPPITEEAFEALELAIRALGTGKNVGTTDVPDTNVGDKIFIQSAIEAIRAALLAWSYMPEWRDNKIIEAIKQLPPVQTDKDKVSNLLYHIYSIKSPHLDVTGVVAKKYYCEELWKELFGKESELPGWMT